MQLFREQQRERAAPRMNAALIDRIKGKNVCVSSPRGFYNAEHTVTFGVVSGVSYGAGKYHVVILITFDEKKEFTPVLQMVQSREDRWTVVDEPEPAVMLVDTGDPPEIYILGDGPQYEEHMQAYMMQTSSRAGGVDVFADFTDIEDDLYDM